MGLQERARKRRREMESADTDGVCVWGEKSPSQNNTAETGDNLQQDGRIRWSAPEKKQRADWEY